MAGETSRTLAREDKGKGVPAEEPATPLMEGAFEASLTTPRHVEELENLGLLPRGSVRSVPEIGTPSPAEKAGEVTVLRRYFRSVWASRPILSSEGSSPSGVFRRSI